MKPSPVKMWAIGLLQFLVALTSPDLNAAESSPSDPWFSHRYRRLLLDMHIPGWDERFLSQYRTAEVAEMYEKSGATSAMFYCQSHVGLCYWPTTTGPAHPALKGRDFVGEMLAELRRRHIPGVGYYSVIFNNWAYLEHPEWRTQPVDPPAVPVPPQSRFGTCCPNQPGYRAFTLAQATELARNYEFDGMFFDMTHWPTVCGCSACRSLYQARTGNELPRVVDWQSPEWCRFVTIREAWMDDYTRELTEAVKKARPGCSVYHNYAGSVLNWGHGQSFASARHHSYLGADLYGDPIEQLVTTHLFLNLTPQRPLELMTSLAENLNEHGELKETGRLQTQVFAATAFSSAFLFIDAIDPQGTVNPGNFKRIANIFAKSAPYEPFLGGDLVADIAIYFSGDSKMNFTENGKPVAGYPFWKADYPHLHGVRGAARNLQQSHLPFTIITRKQLPELSRFKVLILPNVLRMDDIECQAVRSFVAGGGRLYASRLTSLTSTDGRRHDDFQLADLFGCHFDHEKLGPVSFLKPSSTLFSKSIGTQKYLAHKNDVSGKSGTVALRLDPRSKTLATLTLAYDTPERGTVGQTNWATIHGSAPWTDTARPAITLNEYGAGRVIYSSADIEVTATEAHDDVFRSLIRELVSSPRYSVDSHPNVWVTVFDQPDKKRWIISLLNYQVQPPVLPVPKTVLHLQAPPGSKFIGIQGLPRKNRLALKRDRSGSITVEVRDLGMFEMFAAEYR